MYKEIPLMGKSPLGGLVILKRLLFCQAYTLEWVYVVMYLYTSRLGQVVS